MTETENQTSTALAIIQSKPVAEFFVADGLDPVIEAIRKEAISDLPDISTPQGRKEIASRAYRVAQSKTAIDDVGKNLTEEWKTKSKAVDAERKRWREAMDALKEEIRAPLTEWENAEKKRVADHEAAIADIAHLVLLTDGLSAADLEARIARVAELVVAREWKEFAQRARQTHDSVKDALQKKLDARRQHEADQAELERLRREKEERERLEREERLKAEAAEAARLEAEEKARKEAEQVEQARLEAERKAKEAADALAAKVKADADAAAAREEAAKREAAEAEERAKKAEEDRLAAIAQAEADKVAAAKKAEDDRIAAEEKARQEERDRTEAEKKAEGDAAAKREADKAHRGKINREALAALVAAGIAEEVGKLVIEAIAKGLVPHVRISY